MLVKIIGKMKISSRIFVIYIINIAIITINTIKTITMPIFCQDFFPMLHHEESPQNSISSLMALVYDSKNAFRLCNIFNENNFVENS